MHLSLDGFCEVIKKLNKKNAEKALTILWYLDDGQPGIAKTAGQLAKVLDDHQADFKSGAIGLQHTGQTIEFRNFKIKTL